VLLSGGLPDMLHIGTYLGTLHAGCLAGFLLFEARS